MPRIPKEILGRLKSLRKNTIKSTYKYGVIVILALELFSLVACELSDNYLYFWYPILTQLTFAIFILSIICTPPKVAPCIRKKVAMYCLASYYLFGVFCIIFNINNEFYTTYISYGLLLSSLFIVLNTILKKK